MFATAIDETRPVLTGVFVKVADTTLKMVTTDSYRLADHLYRHIIRSKVSFYPTVSVDDCGHRLPSTRAAGDHARSHSLALESETLAE